MKPAAAIVEPIDHVAAGQMAELEEITARIRMLKRERPESMRALERQQRNLQKKARAAKAGLALALTNGKALLDPEGWAAMLTAAGLTAEEAESRMQYDEVADQVSEAVERVRRARDTRDDGPIPSAPSSRVYFIQGEGGGPIKIGHSYNPERRLADLQVGSPTRLRLIGTAVGGKQSEKALHGRLQQHRLHGEWFADVSEVVAAIAEVLR